MFAAGQDVEGRLPVPASHEVDDGGYTVGSDPANALGNTFPVGHWFRAEFPEEVMVPLGGGGDHAGAAGTGNLDAEGILPKGWRRLR
jgi:hypothetical protein